MGLQQRTSVVEQSACLDSLRLSPFLDMSTTHQERELAWQGTARDIDHFFVSLVHVLASAQTTTGPPSIMTVRVMFSDPTLVSQSCAHNH